MIRTFRTPKYRCKVCETVWIGKSYEVGVEDPLAIECPHCQKNTPPNPVRKEKWLAVGATNRVVRAVDETHRICENTYGLTNLKDNARVGEVMAPQPSIDPDMKKAMDKTGGFFGGGSKGNVVSLQGAMGIAQRAKAERMGDPGAPDAFQVQQSIKSRDMGIIEETRAFAPASRRAPRT